jgi:hypothetical protein
LTLELKKVLAFINILFTLLEYSSTGAGGGSSRTPGTTRNFNPERQLSDDSDSATTSDEEEDVPPTSSLRSVAAALKKASTNAPKGKKGKKAEKEANTSRSNPTKAAGATTRSKKVKS